MLRSLSKALKNWWILLILGILCAICAGMVFFNPVVGTRVFSIVLIVNLLTTGVLEIAFVWSNRKSIPAWGWNMILPILTVIAGIILLCRPLSSALFVIIIFAASALFTAIETIASAISLSRVKAPGWVWTLIVGIIELILSFILFANPLFTGLAAGFYIAFALFFMAIDSITIAIQLHKVKKAAEMAEEAVQDTEEKKE